MAKVAKDGNELAAGNRRRDDASALRRRWTCNATCCHCGRRGSPLFCSAPPSG